MLFVPFDDELNLFLLSKFSDVDVERLAQATTGFCGADLQNLINTAAIKAATSGKRNVSMKELDFAIDKIIMGDFLCLCMYVCML